METMITNITHYKLQRLLKGVLPFYFLTFLALFMVCLTTMPLKAQNPIICDRYTPDPAPYVHGDTLYLFVDHDENETLNN